MYNVKWFAKFWVGDFSLTDAPQLNTVESNSYQIRN